MTHNLAALYLARGETDGALDAYRTVVDIKSTVLGPTTPDVSALRHTLETLTHAAGHADGRSQLSSGAENP